MFKIKTWRLIRWPPSLIKRNTILRHTNPFCSNSVTVIRCFLLWGLSCYTTQVLPFCHIHTKYNRKHVSLGFIAYPEIYRKEGTHTTRRPRACLKITCTKLSCTWDTGFDCIWSVRSSRHVKLCFGDSNFHKKSTDCNKTQFQHGFRAHFVIFSSFISQFCSVMTLISLVKFAVVIRGKV